MHAGRGYVTEVQQRSVVDRHLIVEAGFVLP
jgi:hypothetical protein